MSSPKTRSQSSSSYDAKNHYRGPVAANYVRARAADPKWQREQATMRDLLAELPRDRLILDVPFGTGRFAEYYAAGGHRLIGADISCDMLAHSRTVGAVRELAPDLVQADAERLPLPDGSVDYVICSRLFNWIPVPVAEVILGEFLRVARDGVILGVRVGEPLSARDVARRVLNSLSTAPRQAPLRLAKTVARRAGRAVSNLLNQIGRIRPAGDHVPTYPKGYVVPRRAEFEAMLSHHGATIESVHPVDNTYAVRRLMNKELRFYRLRVNRIRSDHEAARHQPRM